MPLTVASESIVEDDIRSRTPLAMHQDIIEMVELIVKRRPWCKPELCSTGEIESLSDHPKSHTRPNFIQNIKHEYLKKYITDSTPLKTLVPGLLDYM